MKHSSSFTNLLLIIMVIILSIIAFRPSILPSPVEASSGSSGNIQFLGSTLGYSLLLDTKTNEVWLANWNKVNEGKDIEWFICGKFAGLGKPLIPTESQIRGQFNSAAQSDLRNACKAQEAYYVHNHTYTDSLKQLIGATYGLYPSKGVTIQIISADKNNCKMVVFHKDGDKKYTITVPGGRIIGVSK